MDTILFGVSSAFPIKKSLSLLSLPLSTNQFAFNSNTTGNKYLRNSPHKVEESRGTSRDDVAAFGEAAYEAERLRLDAEARRSMAEASGREAADETDPKAWKWAIRKRVWDMMEAQKVAQFPRPVHHRIPNFVGASAAANKLSELEVFRVSKCVKVNPDSPQKQVRFITLDGGKKLLTPQPRLRTGFFSILESHMLTPSTLNEACTSVGVAKYGRPIGLDEKIKVDLIVIGSVAVDPNTGARLGKGEDTFYGASMMENVNDGIQSLISSFFIHFLMASYKNVWEELTPHTRTYFLGFAELEYGMLRYMGAIDDSTPVVTSVHDIQLVDDIPVEKLLIHDVPVDIVCTPTQVIFTNTRLPKPQGIYWDKLSPEKLGQIRVLQELKRKIEEETGQKLPSGPSEKLPPTAQRRR